MASQNNVSEPIPISSGTTTLTTILWRAYDIFERNGRFSAAILTTGSRPKRGLLWKPALELGEGNGEFVLEVAVSCASMVGQQAGRVTRYTKKVSRKQDPRTATTYNRRAS
jgi:hypothetical protein